MKELDVFGVEKTVLSETIRPDGKAAMETRIECTGAFCTGNTCLCAVSEK